MKQADSSLLFPLLMKAGWRDVFPHGSTLSDHSPFWKSSHIWRYKYLLSRKSLHKDTSISVIFWTFLLEKLTNRETHHLIRAFISSSGNNCGNIRRYAYHLNKSLQDFVQRKLEKFEMKLTLCHHIYNCHFPFVWCFNRYEYK